MLAYGYGITPELPTYFCLWQARTMDQQKIRATEPNRIVRIVRLRVDNRSVSKIRYVNCCQMKYLDLTFRSPAANLACDEALIDLSEDGCEDEVLRFWTAPQPFVVLGFANQAGAEVNLEACRRRNIPVLRRCSGGGAVVQGPGCLNYSLVLRIQDSSPLLNISETNVYIMKRHQVALEPILKAAVTVEGHTDLTLGKLKFSGNAQRRKRRYLLFHGTFLLDFDLSLLTELLPIPARQPAYRENRPHARFVTNLNVPPDSIRRSLSAAWKATETFHSILQPAVDRLVDEKYSRDDWNYRF
ncbi:MAG: lipoate--protein ligase family protein [Verrucomicrobia bacterium]|nr:lipoate--protein ligase family protein [Verrucomicrobiota bacterium]